MMKDLWNYQQNSKYREKEDISQDIEQNELTHNKQYK